MSSIGAVHGIGAMIFFFVGILYCFLQAGVTYMLYPDFNGLQIFHIRLAISIVSLASVIGMSVVQYLGRIDWSSEPHNHPAILRIPGDKGFVMYTVASSLEWFISLNFIFYFFSFIREYQKIAVDVTVYPLVSHFDFEPVDVIPEKIKLRAGMMIMLDIGMREWSHSRNKDDNMQLRKPTDQGYVSLTIAAILEWFVGALIVSSFISFTNEFRKTGIELKIYPLERYNWNSRNAQTDRSGDL